MPPVTRADRIERVSAAADALTKALHDARVIERLLSGHPDTFDSWEAVEKHGATIHRQARLLAGKTKGG